MHRNKYLLTFFIISGGLFTLYLSLNFDQLMTRGLSARPEIWAIALENISHNTVFGSGIGTNISIYVVSLKRLFTDTHNIHLGLTYSLGITGLLIWTGLLISLLNIYLKNKQSIIAQTGIVLLAYGMTAGMTEGTSIFTRPKEIWFLSWLPISLLFTVEYQRLIANNLNPLETESNIPSKL
jgi:O-antigen ligase